MPKTTKTADDRKILLEMIEEAYRLPNWNETGLRSTLQRVNPQMASWRPLHAKRSIADIVVHCAYWKYALRRRLVGGRRGGFPLKGSNWFKTPDSLSRDQWIQYRTLLDEEHERLVEAIMNYRRVIAHAKPRSDGRWTTVQRTFWQAIHDGYHTGQINMIKAMYRRANN
jgi:hypothetical protein